MHTKEALSEYIFKLIGKHSFQHVSASLQILPIWGYSYNDSLPKDFLNEIKEEDWFTEPISSVICVFDDRNKRAEKIVYTEKMVFINPYQNDAERLALRYDDIKELKYTIENVSQLLIVDNREKKLIFSTASWNDLILHEFLQFATQKYRFKRIDSVIPLDTIIRADRADLVKKKDNHPEASAAGIVYGNVSNASSHYFDDKIVSPRGHGFAAENANHLVDKLRGKDAHIVGNDNAPNGADRIVEGVQIQSKYCVSGSKCVSECFENGKFRYWNPDGTPMQIEVPSDKYDAAIQAMERRIKNGEVNGVSDPAEARNIIRKGHFTYTQAKNIAKAGTLESIMYDAASGMIIARNAFGITAVLSFATAIWNGDDLDVALKNSLMQGLEVGGTTFLTAVLSGQLGRAGINSMLIGGSDAIVRAIGPKTSAVIINALRSGTNIYGVAAMKSLAKLLRTNVVTGTVSIAVLSVGDVTNIFRGRISGAQLLKNVSKTAANIAGGSAGWVAGAAAGAAAGAKVGALMGSVIPGVGTIAGSTAGSAAGGLIGGLLGSAGGGTAAGKATDVILDNFIEDDADKMVDIIQMVFTELAGEYLLNKEEADQILVILQSELSAGVLKDMFASSNREVFARKLLEPRFEHVANNRVFISLPTESQLQRGICAMLESIADMNDVITAESAVGAV